MFKTSAISTICLFSLLSSLGLAANSADQIAQTNHAARNFFVCPNPKSLTKDTTKMIWSADNGKFKSYDMSFATGIHKFIGAQWVGANVGQITCVYQANPSSSFPILLVFHTLTQKPTAKNWGQDKGGYFNCHADVPTLCPFKIVLKPKQSNIYQEAENLKTGD